MKRKIVLRTQKMLCATLQVQKNFLRAPLENSGEKVFMNSARDRRLVVKSLAMSSPLWASLTALRSIERTSTRI